MFVLRVQLPPECADVYRPRVFGQDVVLHDLEALFRVESIAREPWAQLMQRFCLASRLETELIHAQLVAQGMQARPLVTAKVSVAADTDADGYGDVNVRVVCTFHGAHIRRAKLLFPQLFHLLQLWPTALEYTHATPRLFGFDVLPCELALQKWLTFPDDDACCVYDMLMAIPPAGTPHATAAIGAADDSPRPALFRVRPLRLFARDVTVADVSAVARELRRPAPRAGQIAFAAWAREIETRHPLSQCFANASARLDGLGHAPGAGGIVVCPRGAGRRLAVHMLCAADTECFAQPDECAPPELASWRLLPQFAHCSTLELRSPDRSIHPDLDLDRDTDVESDADADAADPLSACGADGAGTAPGATLVLAASAVDAARWHAAFLRAHDAAAATAEDATEDAAEHHTDQERSRDRETAAVLYQGGERVRQRAEAALPSAAYVVTTYATLEMVVALQKQAHTARLRHIRWRCPGTRRVVRTPPVHGATAIIENSIVTNADATMYHVVHVSATRRGHAFGNRVLTTVPLVTAREEVELKLTRDLAIVGFVEHCFEEHACVIDTPRCVACGFDCAPIVTELRRRLPAHPLLRRCWRRVVCDAVQHLNTAPAALRAVTGLRSARRWCLFRPRHDAPAPWLPPCDGGSDTFAPLTAAFQIVGLRAPALRSHTAAWFLEPLITVLPALSTASLAPPPRVMRIDFACDDDRDAYERVRRALGQVVRMHGTVHGHVGARSWAVMTTRLHHACAVLPASDTCYAWPHTFTNSGGSGDVDGGVSGGDDGDGDGVDHDICPICHEAVAPPIDSSSTSTSTSTSTNAVVRASIRAASDEDLEPGEIAEPDEPAPVVALPCGHGFCKTCLATVLLGRSQRCEYCMQALTLQDVHAALITCSTNTRVASVAIGRWPRPRAPRGAHKVLALMRALRGSEAATATLVLTQFQRSIACISNALRYNGIATVPISASRIGSSSSSRRRVASIATATSSAEGPRGAVVVTTPTIAHLCSAIDVARFAHVVFVDVAVTPQQYELMSGIERTAAVCGAEITHLVTAETIEEVCFVQPLQANGGYNEAPWLLEA